MIKVNQIQFTYPNSKEVVFKDITFDVDLGSVCAIIGKNGCGKTTLIKCMTGILSPELGSIEILQPSGYVPQKVNFIYDMKVLDAIVMGRYHSIGPFSLPQKLDYDIARNCADELKITPLLDKNFSELSGGQQQMVLLARALAVGSECILFDEPFSALDYGNQNQIMAVIKKLSKTNITAIFSTHDPNHVLHIADKVLIMKESGDFLFGPVNEVMTDKVLSDLYGMHLKQIKVDQNTSAVVAMYD